MDLTTRLALLPVNDVPEWRRWQGTPDGPGGGRFKTFLGRADLSDGRHDDDVRRILRADVLRAIGDRVSQGDPTVSRTSHTTLQTGPTGQTNGHGLESGDAL